MLEPVKEVLKVIDDNDLWKEGIILIGSWTQSGDLRSLGVKECSFVHPPVCKPPR